MKNQKTKIAIISVVALLLALIGVTYAYWLVTKTQTNSNIISSACLDITLDNESEEINLTSQYPMSDEEGMKLTPYTFTVTNNCNTSVDYQVALEATGDEATSIASSAMKVALDNNPKVYSSYSEVTPTISGAYESRSIGYARLAANGNEGSSVSHSLRIWIDENAPISEANKTFQSKISVTIGQGVQNPYIEGTLAFDILSNNGGAGAVTIIDENDYQHRIKVTKDVSVSSTGTFYYGTSFDYDKSTGKYTLSGDLVQSTLKDCRNGTNPCGKYTLRNADPTYSDTSIYEIINFKTTYSVTANQLIYTNEFGTVTSSNDAGLYKMQDDLGDSYYFRGAPTNNYVQFGIYEKDAVVYSEMVTTYTFMYTEEGDGNGENEYNYADVTGNPIDSLEECEEIIQNYSFMGGNTFCEIYEEKEVGFSFNQATPMYWRIVRINGDGTIRLIYDGTAKAENGVIHEASIGDSQFSENLEGEEEAKYLNSKVNDYLNNWYNTHLKTNYGSYIADGIFCNDMQVTSYYDNNNNVETLEKPESNYNTYYAPKYRLSANKTPRLTCSRVEDRYSKTSAIGNGLLEHPVGLLTADEAVFAGGSSYLANDTNYLYTGVRYWLLSPWHYDTNELSAYIWTVASQGNLPGSLAAKKADDIYSVRPVINLRANVEFTGNGSYETPYVIVTE